MDIPDWITDPFGFDASSVKLEIQEDFISLQNDFELKPAFKKKGYQAFWLQSQLRLKYSSIWSQIEVLFLSFPSSYLVEKAFSVVSFLLNKRNRLNIVDRGNLRLYLTNLKPDIDGLVRRHQAQPSH